MPFVAEQRFYNSVCAYNRSALMLHMRRMIDYQKWYGAGGVAKARQPPLPTISPTYIYFLSQLLR